MTGGSWHQVGGARDAAERPTVPLTLPPQAMAWPRPDVLHGTWVAGVTLNFPECSFLSQIPRFCLSNLNFGIPGNQEQGSPAGAHLELPRVNTQVPSHCWGILLNLHFMRLWGCENSSRRMING